MIFFRRLLNLAKSVLLPYKVLSHTPPTRPFTYDELVELCGCADVEMTTIEILESGMRYCEFLESEAERLINEWKYYEAIELLSKINRMCMCIDLECLKLDIENFVKLRDHLLLQYKDRQGQSAASL